MWSICFQNFLRFLSIPMLLSVFIFSSHNSFAYNRAEMLEKSYDKKFVDRLKEEVLSSFTLFNNPITPFAIHHMIPLISDMMPSTITIDLLSTVDSNQFYGDFEKYDSDDSLNNKRLTSYKTKEEDPHDIRQYTFIGKLGSDKVILRADSYLIVLKIVTDKAISTSFENKRKKSTNEIDILPRYRLVAKQVAYMYFPFYGDMELKGNTLKVKQKDKSIVILNLSKIIEL